MFESWSDVYHPIARFRFCFYCIVHRFGFIFCFISLFYLRAIASIWISYPGSPSTRKGLTNDKSIVCFCGFVLRAGGKRVHNRLLPCDDILQLFPGDNVQHGLKRRSMFVLGAADWLCAPWSCGLASSYRNNCCPSHAFRLMYSLSEWRRMCTVVSTAAAGDYHTHGIVKARVLLTVLSTVCCKYFCVCNKRRNMLTTVP